MEDLKKKIIAEAIVCAAEEVTSEDINTYESADILTENTGRSGKNYLWWLDERLNILLDIESGEIIDGEDADVLSRKEFE